jgi:hypothetical protein
MPTDRDKIQTPPGRFSDHLTPRDNDPQVSLPNIALLRPRSFQRDLERLSREYSTAIQEEVPQGAVVGAAPVGQPLPDSGMLGRRVRIATFSQVNQQGKRWGITAVNRNLVQEARDVIDGQLLEELKTALQELGITCGIFSALRRGSGVGAGSRSRHNRGKALDIDPINGRDAALHNPDAVRLVEWFIAHGYHPGSELPGKRGLLFGPVGHRWNKTQYNHDNHLHISIP